MRRPFYCLWCRNGGLPESQYELASPRGRVDDVDVPQSLTLLGGINFILVGGFEFSSSVRSSGLAQCWVKV